MSSRVERQNALHKSCLSRRTGVSSPLQQQTSPGSSWMVDELFYATWQRRGGLCLGRSIRVAQPVEGSRRSTYPFSLRSNSHDLLQERDGKSCIVAQRQRPVSQEKRITEVHNTLHTVHHNF